MNSHSLNSIPVNLNRGNLHPENSFPRILASNPTPDEVVKLSSSIYRLFFLCAALASTSVFIYVVSRYHPIFVVFNIPIAFGIIWALLLFAFADGLRRHFGFKATISTIEVRTAQLKANGSWVSQFSPLVSVNQIEIKQSPLGRALDYADVYLFSTNKTLVLSNIDNPFEIAVRIDDARDRAFEGIGAQTCVCQYKVNGKRLSSLCVSSGTEIAKRPLLQKRTQLRRSPTNRKSNKHTNKLADGLG